MTPFTRQIVRDFIYKTVRYYSAPNQSNDQAILNTLNLLVDDQSIDRDYVLQIITEFSPRHAFMWQANTLLQ